MRKAITLAGVLLGGLALTGTASAAVQPHSLGKNCGSAIQCSTPSAFVNGGNLWIDYHVFGNGGGAEVDVAWNGTQLPGCNAQVGATPSAGTYGCDIPGGGNVVVHISTSSPTQMSIGWHN